MFNLILLAAMLLGGLDALAPEFAGGRSRKVRGERKATPTPKQMEVVLTEDGEAAFALVDSSPPDGEQIRSELEHIYRVYNASKLAEIDTLLEKYAGKEALLLSAVKAKYLGVWKNPDVRSKSSLSGPQREERARIEQLVSDLPKSLDASFTEMSSLDPLLVDRALKRRVRQLVEEGQEFAALSIASRASALGEYDDKYGDRLGNVRGAMGVFGSAMAARGLARSSADAFAAIAAACGRPEALVHSIDSVYTAHSEAATLALCELCRRLLRNAKAAGRPRPWRTALLLTTRLGPSLGGYMPELGETATRSMVANVKRYADADTMARLPRNNVLPEIACIGRSNAGKSSLVNLFLGRKALAPTSRDPGRTRRLVFYAVNQRHSSAPPFFLVDVPGLGFATDSEHGTSTKIDSWRSLNERYLRVRDSLCCVLHLIDSRRAAEGTLQATDLVALDLCSAANLGRPKNHFYHVIVLTKTDRLSVSKLDAAVSTVGTALADRALVSVSPPHLDSPLPSPHHVPIVLTSATHKLGVLELWRTLATALALHDPVRYRPDDAILLPDFDKILSDVTQDVGDDKIITFLSDDD